MQKFVFILVMILLLTASCKKSGYKRCETCACFNTNNLNYRDTMIDSASFFQSIMGTWYVKQSDTFVDFNCSVQCFCDSQYFVIILPNNSIIASLPGSRRDTFPLNFRTDDHGKVDPLSGIYIIPGDQGRWAYLTYNNSSLQISTETLSAGTVFYSPNYYLIR